MIRGLVETYYDIQKERIAVEGQLRALEQGVAEQDKEFLKEEVVDRLITIEKDLYKYLANHIQNNPLWINWLKDVKGIGPVLSCGLIAWIEDIGKFDTISKLWAYSGLSVDEDGRAVRRKAGQKIKWNPRMKAHCWKIGESFVKTKGGYRELYDKFRGDYDKKWTTPELCGSVGCKNKKKCLDGHRFAAAKRKTVKVFLAHFWTMWRQQEGLEVRPCFIIGRSSTFNDGTKGHKHEHEIPVIKK